MTNMLSTGWFINYSDKIELIYTTVSVVGILNLTFSLTVAVKLNVIVINVDLVTIGLYSL